MQQKIRRLFSLHCDCPFSLSTSNSLLKSLSLSFSLLPGFLNSLCIISSFCTICVVTENNVKTMALSMKASCNSHGQDSSYFLGWQEYDKNPYDHVGNPTGIIQLGLAENRVG